MATYTYQVSSGSATAAGDLATIGAGVHVTGNLTAFNPTHLAYGFYAVNSSGQIFVQGGLRSSAGYVNGTTHGLLIFGAAASALPLSGAALGSGRTYPLMTDLNGALWVAPSATIGVSGNAVTAFISGTATITGNVGVSAGTVSAFQLGPPWSVSGSALTAFISGTATITGNVGVSGGSLGITGGGGLTGLAGTALAIPASAHSLTASAVTPVSGQTVGSLVYLKGHNTDNIIRWFAVPTAATASADVATGIGMVAPMWQYDDTSTQTAAENHFGVPRMSSARIAYVTATGLWPVSTTGQSITAFISGTATITGNVGVSAGTVTALLSGTATVSGQVSATARVSSWGTSAVSDATAITAGMGLSWSVPMIGSINVGYKPDGAGTYEPAMLAKLFDVDTAVGTQENVMGVTIRAATAGGSNPVAVVDNTAFTDGTTGVLPAGYILDETPGTALSENDAAAARIDSKRAQVFVIEDETTRGQRATVTLGKALLQQPYFSSATLTQAAGAATGGTVSLLTGPVKTWMVQLSATGSTAAGGASAATATLQGSLDGNSWYFICSAASTASTTTLTGATASVVDRPFTNYRIVLSASAVVSASATALGMN